MKEKIKQFIIKWLIPLSKKGMVAYLRKEGYTVMVPVSKK